MPTRDELLARLAPDEQRMLEGNIREARRHIAAAAKDLERGFVGPELRIAARLLTDLHDAAKRAQTEAIAEEWERKAEQEHRREALAANPEHQERVTEYLGSSSLR